MQVYAHLRNLRIAPRKVRLVIDLVRGMTIESALNQLAFNPKAASEPIAKLIKSAAANAEHNFQLDPSTLRIAKITADAGRTLHRSRARAHGSAAPIRKRSSHITIILSDESIADVHKNQRTAYGVRRMGEKKPEQSQEKKITKKSEMAKGEKKAKKKPNAKRQTPNAN
jgi:large subunit ribosomal protein L22